MTPKVTPIRPEPEKPTADGLDSTDLTGIQTGNEDIAHSSQWVETYVQPGLGPLPIYPTTEDKEPLWRLAAGRCDAAAKWVRYALRPIDPRQSLYYI